MTGETSRRRSTSLKVEKRVGPADGGKERGKEEEALADSRRHERRGMYNSNRYIGTEGGEGAEREKE